MLRLLAEVADSNPPLLRGSRKVWPRTDAAVSVANKVDENEQPTPLDDVAIMPLDGGTSPVPLDPGVSPARASSCSLRRCTR